MTIKTYAIHGLSEWHGDIKAGAISVRVSFTGGTASPSGALPAYFMTKDPVTQFVIENSKEYKNGFISLEMQQTIAGEHPRMATHKPTPAEVAGSVTPESDEAEEVAEETSETAAAETEKAEAEDNGNVVKVATKGDAVEWLKEHYPEEGYTSVKLRGKAFDEACKKHGVEFEIG